MSSDEEYLSDAMMSDQEFEDDDSLGELGTVSFLYCTRVKGMGGCVTLYTQDAVSRASAGGEVMDMKLTLVRYGRRLRDR